MNQNEATILSEYGYGTPNQPRPGVNLPPGWSEVNIQGLGLTQTVGSAQFRVFINEQTKEITFSFKGSTSFEDFRSDLVNDGWSQYQQIRGFANDALQQLRVQFPGYSFGTTGHSLGGGQAQTFGLENNLNVIAVNSLPISRGAIQEIWGGEEGYLDALSAWSLNGNSASFVRTPNDIASLWYRDLRQEAYLMGEQITLPGTGLPPALVPIMLGLAPFTGGASLALLGAILLESGVDHTTNSLRAAAGGLGVDGLGNFVVPNRAILDIPAAMRAHTGELFDSPVTGVTQEAEGVFRMDRLDGTSQRLTVRGDGSIETSTANADGTLTYHEVYQDGTYVISIETEDGFIGECSVVPSQRLVEYSIKTPDSEVELEGSAQVTADAAGNLTGVEEHESWKQDGTEIARTETVTSADGEDVTERVDIDGSELLFDIDEDGDGTVLDVFSVQGRELSAEERSNLLQALNSAGVRPEDLLAPVRDDDGQADVILQDGAGGIEMQIQMGDDEELVFEYLIMEGGSPVLESVSYQGEELSQGQMTVFNFLLPGALLDDDGTVEIDDLGGADFEVLFSNGAGELHAILEDETLQLEIDDWPVGGVPGFDIVIDDAHITAHGSGAQIADISLAIVGFPFQQVHAAIASDGTQYSFLTGLDGSTAEQFFHPSPDNFYINFYHHLAADGSEQQFQLAYDEGGLYNRGFTSEGLPEHELRFGPFGDQGWMIFPSFDPDGVSSGDHAAGVRYDYRASSGHVVAQGFDDEHTNITYFGDGSLSRSLTQPKEGYETYSEVRLADGSIVSYAATSEDGWSWSERHEFGTTIFWQRNPFGETFTWTVNSLGNGSFRFQGPSGGVSGEVRSHAFFIEIEDAEGEPILVQVPFGYSGEFPSHGFSLAERLEPIDNFQPLIDHRIVTVGIDTESALSLQAHDQDGDAIVSYEFRQTRERETSARLELGDTALDVSDGFEVSAGAIGSLEVRGGLDTGTDQFWVRAFDGELWSPWTPIGVRTASVQAPEVQQTRGSIRMNDTVAIAAFFQASDPEEQDIRFLEFEDTTGSAGSAYLQFGGVAQRAGTVINVSPADLSLVTLRGAAQPLVDDVIRVRAFDGELWSDWRSFLIRTSGNLPPQLMVPIADRTAAEDLLFVHTIPEDSFVDPEGGSLSYLAQLADGSALPDWLTFNAGARTFVGVPDQDDVGTISVQVFAVDSGLLAAHDFFDISIAATNDAPVVTASAATLAFNQSAAAATLFSVSDEEDDAIAQYEFFDSTPGVGHFSVNGVAQDANVAIPVSAGDLANTTFTAGAANGSDLVWVRVNDGQEWSAWRSWAMYSSPHFPNALPTVSAVNVELLRNSYAAASSLFSVTDADGDPIGGYELWDDVDGGGYWTIDGVQQAARQTVVVAAADLADTLYVAGSEPGTELVWARASDGIGWSDWRSWSMTSALHVPNAAPEVSAAASQTVVFNEPRDASTLFAASDADGDPVVRYELWDSTAGNGHFTVSGVEQGVNVAIAVSAAELANAQFVGASAIGSDLVWVRASDDQEWGAWKSWTMSSSPHATNAAPVITAADATLLTNQVAAADSLFSATDGDGDAFVQYEFWDDVNGGGYWRIGGVQQAAAQTVSVSAAQLADTDYVAGASGGTERVWVRVSDGMEWSVWKPWNMTTALHVPNSAPVVAASASQTVLLGAAVDASTLFSVTDAESDAVTQYEFWDSTAGNGRFTVGGVEQGVNAAIAVNAGQLADTRFVGAGAIGSDLVWVRVNDGQVWSDWKSWTMQSSPHLTNAAPTASAANAGLLANESVAASSLFSVLDADGDAIARYEFWDDVNGGGRFEIDGVQQAAVQTIAVAAEDLDDVAYVGGANPGTERVWVRASDGMAWSSWQSWLMATEGGMLRGGAGPDTLAGNAATPVLEGGGGDDSLNAGGGNSLLSGGAGSDAVNGGAGNDVLAGGSGNDAIHTGGGHNVVVFNAGGGTDTVWSDGDASNTISLGGGIQYDDLRLSKVGDDLILSTGGEDEMVLKDWYAGSDDVEKLQVILDSTEAYDPGSADPLVNAKVQTFDFRGLVAKFDEARAETPGLTSWAMTNALLSFHLSRSDDDAIGGDLAYWYGRNGGFTGISLQAAQQVIGAADFGAEAQQLRAFSGLQEGLVKLS